MTRVCLSGARGRMGRMLVDLVQAAHDLRLGSTLERSDHPELGVLITQEVKLTSDARAAIMDAEVVLDFSLPDAVMEHLELSADLGKPLVTGTTGFSKPQAQELSNQSKQIPIVLASNMSRGVHLLTHLAGKAAAVLCEHDAEILEIHHRNKVDVPSGTAQKLAEVVRSHGSRTDQVYGRNALRKPGQVGIAALRGGDVVGEHQVMFLASGEQLILTHRATSREHFGRGALDAVRFIVGQRPGMYGMSDVFGGMI